MGAKLNTTTSSCIGTDPYNLYKVRSIDTSNLLYRS